MKRIFLFMAALIFACHSAMAADLPAKWTQKVDIRADKAEIGADSAVLEGVLIKLKDGSEINIAKLAISQADIENFFNGKREAGAIEISGLAMPGFTAGKQKYIGVAGDFGGLLNLFQKSYRDAAEAFAENPGVVASFSFRRCEGEDLTSKNNELTLHIQKSSVENGTLSSSGRQNSSGIKTELNGKPFFTIAAIDLESASMEDIGQLLGLSEKLLAKKTIAPDEARNIAGVSLKNFRISGFQSENFSAREALLNLDVNKDEAKYSLAVKNLETSGRWLSLLGYMSPPEKIDASVDLDGRLKIVDGDLEISQKASLYEPKLLDFQGAMEAAIDDGDSFSIVSLETKTRDLGMGEGMGLPLKTVLAAQGNNFLPGFGDTLKTFLDKPGATLVFGTNELDEGTNIQDAFHFEVN